MLKSCAKPTPDIQQDLGGDKTVSLFCIGMVLEKERSGNYCHFHGEQTWTTLKQTKWICAVCCFWPPKTSASIFNSGSATGNCAVFLSAGSDGRWSTQAVGMVWHIGVSKWLSGCEARSIFFASKNQFLVIDSLFSPVEALETGLPSGFSSSYFKFGSHFSFLWWSWSSNHWEVPHFGLLRPAVVEVDGPWHPWAWALRRLSELVTTVWDKHGGGSLMVCECPLGVMAATPKPVWNRAQNLKPGWLNSFAPHQKKTRFHSFHPTCPIQNCGLSQVDLQNPRLP